MFVCCCPQNIDEELTVATQAFFESDSLIIDQARREVCCT